MTLKIIKRNYGQVYYNNINFKRYFLIERSNFFQLKKKKKSLYAQSFVIQSHILLFVTRKCYIYIIIYSMYVRLYGVTVVPEISL